MSGVPEVFRTWAGTSLRTSTLGVPEMFRARAGAGPGAPTSGVPKVFRARDGNCRGTPTSGVPEVSVPEMELVVEHLRQVVLRFSCQG